MLQELDQYGHFQGLRVLCITWESTLDVLRSSSSFLRAHESLISQSMMQVCDQGELAFNSPS